MTSYVKVGENEESEIVEVPAEKSDGSLLLSTVTAQFPEAVGLRYKTDTGAWKLCRIEGNIINKPLDGWGETTYFISTKKPLKREADSEDLDYGEPAGKLSRMTKEEILSDLMISQMAYSVTDEEMKDHFEGFGELEYCKLIKDKDGKSRGFGFLKYKTVDAVERAFGATHFLKGRRYDIQYSNKKQTMQQNVLQTDNIQTKLFVGKLPSGTTAMDLQEHFSQYGVLKDVYLPTPFKGFGFILFGSQAVANRVLRDEHTIKGVEINVNHPSERSVIKRQQRLQNGPPIEPGSCNMQPPVNSSHPTNYYYANNNMSSYNTGGYTTSNYNPISNPYNNNKNMGNTNYYSNTQNSNQNNTQSNTQSNSHSNTHVNVQSSVQSNVQNNMPNNNNASSSAAPSNLPGNINRDSWMQGIAKVQSIFQTFQSQAPQTTTKMLQPQYTQSNDSASASNSAQGGTNGMSNATQSNGTSFGSGLNSSGNSYQNNVQSGNSYQNNWMQSKNNGNSQASSWKQDNSGSKSNQVTQNGGSGSAYSNYGNYGAGGNYTWVPPSK